MTIEELYNIIKDRKKNIPKDSYVASLLRDGNDRIIQKIGEEATEVVIAAKNQEKQQIIAETADLLFHLCIMLALFEIRPDEILQELTKRNKRK